MQGRPRLKFFDSRVPSKLEYPQSDSFKLIRGAAKKSPQATALTFQGRSLNYSQLMHQIEMVAGALARRGVHRGCPVMLLMANSPQMVISYLALQRLGAAAVLAQATADDKDLTGLILQSRTSALIADEQYCRLINKNRHRLSLDSVIYCSPADMLTKGRRAISALIRGVAPGGAKADIRKETGDERFAKLLAENSPAPQRQLLDPADTAAVIYSGRAGKRRGVMLPQRALVVNQIQLIHCLELGPNDTVLAAASLSRGPGLALCINAVLGAGGCLALPARQDAKAVLESLQRRSPTVLAVSADMLAALATRPELARRSHHGLRVVVAGGEGLSDELAQRFAQAVGAPLVFAHGPDDAALITSLALLEPGASGRDIGLPLPDVQWLIADPRARLSGLPPGSPGELALRGPAMINGYFNQPAETTRALRGGWMLTGERGVMDASGRVRLTAG